MMSTIRQDKPGGKRSRKAEQRSQKRDQPRSPTRGHRGEDQIGATAAPTNAPTNGAGPSVQPADSPSIGAVAPRDDASTKTIANAYGNYTRRSFQDTVSFVEKLMGARSFDKAVEIQTDFARQAYVNFIAESQKISELYCGFPRQILRSWEGFAARMTQAGR
jgi:hypothetical protein